MRTLRVALVVMPFAAADRPSLAVGLLQAGLRQRGIDNDAFYLNGDFQQAIGREAYTTLAQGLPMTALAGEWIFSQVFHAEAGRPISDWDRYSREVLDDPVWGVAAAERPKLLAALDAAPAFVERCFAAADWSRYDLVGFTSTFEQTMASLCLARKIRAAHPEVRIALGGANFEAGMGRPYIEHHDFVDFVATGEADLSFPLLCERLAELVAGRTERLEVPPGFLYRENGTVVSRPRSAASFVELDNLPTPDYDDFFRARQGRTNGKPPWIPVEASRGCWWGERSHCTFCGLNGATMTFRSKDWRRVAAEVDELVERHGDVRLQFADNILGMGYFRDLLPHWAEHTPRPLKFFEIKANLRRSQVRAMKAAGIAAVQAGVESLSDNALELMGKGMTGAQNIALLRWCVEEGVVPQWNVLYGFPGEDPDDYPRQLGTLRRMTHLPPPTGMGIIRLDRFSPNFTRAREHGFEAVRPMAAYRHLHAMDEAELAELAYYFEYRHPGWESAVESGREIIDFCLDWQTRERAGHAGELTVRPHIAGGTVLVDRRYNFDATVEPLSDLELALLLACDAPVARRHALARVGAAWPGAAAEAEAALSRLVELSAVAEVGPRLVTLAILPSAERLAEPETWHDAPAVPVERAG